MKAAPQVPSPPTVGRIVHYTSHGTPGGEYLPEQRAAVVTQVHPLATNSTAYAVGLAVLNPTGMFFNEFVQYAETPTPGCWSWPRYA